MYRQLKSHDASLDSNMACKCQALSRGTATDKEAARDVALWMGRANQQFLHGRELLCKISIPPRFERLYDCPLSELASKGLFLESLSRKSKLPSTPVPYWSTILENLPCGRYPRGLFETRAIIFPQKIIFYHKIFYFTLKSDEERKLITSVFRAFFFRKWQPVFEKIIDSVCLPSALIGKY